MVDAAELVVGQVLELSDEGSFSSVSFGQQQIAPAGYNLISTVLTAPASIQPAACSLTVKFKLLRYHY